MFGLLEERKYYSLVLDESEVTTVIRIINKTKKRLPKMEVSELDVKAEDSPWFILWDGTQKEWSDLVQLLKLEGFKLSIEDGLERVYLHREEA